jgi:diguanylate cyclase (GGDEF)-like protein
MYLQPHRLNHKVRRFKILRYEQRTGLSISGFTGRWKGRSSMREKASRLIAVLIGDVSTDFSNELMAGISDAGARSKVQLLFLLGLQKHSAPLDANEHKPTYRGHNSVYDYTSFADADGFIIACGSLSGFSGGGVDDEFLEKFGSLPTVVLQQQVEIKNPHQTYIVVDNYLSFCQCVEHLIVIHGYRKIALVSGPKGHPDAKIRTQAFMDCMQKFNMPVTEESIAFGDYSEYIDTVVSELIDRNPGLEAIVFENDEMAKAGYRECRRRGLTVGRDIAITGFDNLSSGRTMEPPLTTISQDIYQMGQMALDRAIQLMDGQTVPPMEMRTEFLLRQSCGCTRQQFCFPFDDQAQEPASLIDAIIREIEGRYTEHFAREARKNEYAMLHNCFAYLRRTALEAPSEPLDYNDLANQLEAFFTAYDQPTLPLSQCLEDYLLRVYTEGVLTPSLGKFTAAVSYMQQFIHARELKMLTNRLDTYNNQSWIAPELTRGLFNESTEEKVFFLLMERLVQSGLRNVYIFLLDHTLLQSNGRVIPQTLRLAAQANPKGVKAYSIDDRPVFDSKHPLQEWPEIGNAHAMMAFSLFSGNHQYGILLCDANRAKSSLLHIIGLQMGMLFDYLGLRDKEKLISAELENIRDKNEILNFLSEYDPLCELLNRRGFIERAIRLNRANIGKTAYCVFIDLDYLKQINDTFGHSEGDIALRGVSTVLKNIPREGDLLGRIGGDEFTGLFISAEPDFETNLLHRIQTECDRYNEQAERPYWLDISVGVSCFVCQQGLEVSSVIAEADQRMYEAKRRRLNRGLRLR